MNYKISIPVTLFLNILSVTYTIPNTIAVDKYQYCFKNSTWVVPPQTLLAYYYNNASVTPVSDQTVWVFYQYQQGYFSGQSYSAIDITTLSKRYLIGSITPAGKVYINFYSVTTVDTDRENG